MLQMDLVARAISLATAAHTGQVDKGGNPYILHCLAVMEIVSRRVQASESHGPLEQYQAAAVLHDVLEDTPITPDLLRALEVPERVVSAIIVLTRAPDEPYAEYLELIVKRAQCAPTDYLPLVVKLADLEHHLDTSRVHQITKSQAERYRQAKATLEAAMGLTPVTA